MTSAYKKRRRAALFQEQGGLCFWCKREMVLMTPATGRLPRNAATIDHLRDRFHPGRKEPPKGGEQRLVAACFACNHERGRLSAAAQPKEVIWARSRRPPQAMRGEQ